MSDDRTGAGVALLVMYPSDSREASASFGPYAIAAAVDGRVAAGMYPLIVFSHGTGGSGLVHRTTAAYLARHGFIVALPEHPGNNRNDNRLANTLENLEHRPRHVSRIIDWAFDASPFAHHLKPAASAVVGHSIGGYTALALAGGVPVAYKNGTSGDARRVEVAPDERVKALVLLAPATPWFKANDALRAVCVPILMFTGELDEDTPAWHAQIVEHGVSDPRLVDHHIIAGAGHFSFQNPFPPAMSKPDFRPSQDPPGFDRADFNGRMNADIRSFLERVL